MLSVGLGDLDDSSQLTAERGRGKKTEKKKAHLDSTHEKPFLKAQSGATMYTILDITLKATITRE
jgi:hypothetical protein